jgi:translation initiation factor IF-1
MGRSTHSHQGNSLAKEELIEMHGKVEDVLPDSRYRVVLDNGHTLVAYTAGRVRKNHIRILAGDRVSLELSPYDLTKGRIIFRHLDRGPRPGPGTSPAPRR